jgi:hypothetical protein
MVSFNGVFIIHKTILVSGAHFVKWISCFTTEEDFLSPPIKAPYVTLCNNGELWPSVRKNINAICKKTNKRQISILKHHIVLRTKEDQLPRLSTSGLTGKIAIFHIFCLIRLLLASHLCDTNGCLSKDHIIKEAFAINEQRARCGGIILTIRPATRTSPAHIIKATPCKHGENNKPNGDSFEFSCRRIKLCYLDLISLDFLDKIK